MLYQLYHIRCSITMPRSSVRREDDGLLGSSTEEFYEKDALRCQEDHFRSCFEKP